MTSLAEQLPATWRCSRCGQTKPAASFPKNRAMRSGLNSWCRQCSREYQWERQTRQTSPHSTSIAEYLKQRDAINYSRAVCDHIAWYVQRKINEFETEHGMEAPPHMTAILGVAKSIAAQHPRKRRQALEGHYEFACMVCGAEFKSRSPSTMYCDQCRVERRRAQKQAWYQTPTGRNARQAERERARARKPPPQPIVIQCQLCGATVQAKSTNRKYCDDCRYEVKADYGKRYATSVDPELRRERAREAKRRWARSERGKELQREYRRRYKQRKLAEKTS